MDNIKQQILELESLAESLINNDKVIKTINDIIQIIITTFKEGNKVLFCGNGGSAAEAQHIAAELSGKFKIDRKPLPAEACHVNSSFLTAVSNDYDFTKSYERYIEAFGKKGDLLIGFSTSGASPNIVKAFAKAKEIGIKTIAFTGESGGELKKLANIIIKVPSIDVPRIQEIHLLLGHIICEAVEKELFTDENS